MVMELSEDSVIMATRHQIGADMGEDVIVLHLQSGLYFGLGNVAARIWQLLQKPVKVREIDTVLLEEYDVDPERCHSEVMSLVAELLEQGLVEVQA